MRVKLDENLGRRCAELLREGGLDVATVRDQNMCSAPDRELFDVCRKEARCLVTLDQDFSHPLTFSPEDTAGIAVLRLPLRASQSDLEEAVLTFAAALQTRSIAGKLWSVQRGRIREYQPRGTEAAQE